MLKIEPVTLSTDRLVLRPMSREDAAAYGRAASDGALWEKKTTTVPRPEAAAAFIETALAAQAEGRQLPFTTLLRDGEVVIGSTRYLNIDAANRRVEIGHTWIARSHQRSFVNTQAKFLMLRHAFETLGCIAVELRTHKLNDQSRTAILRLGAQARRHPAPARHHARRAHPRYGGLQHRRGGMAGREGGPVGPPCRDRSAGVLSGHFAFALSPGKIVRRAGVPPEGSPCA